MYGILAYVIGVLFGCYWCYVVLARLPGDIAELRQKGYFAAKLSIIVVWVITVLIAIALLGVARLAIEEFRVWF